MSVLDNTRDEKAIFDDLEALCQQPGYAHIIAYFCFRDNSIFSDSKQRYQDLQYCGNKEFLRYYRKS